MTAAEAGVQLYRVLRAVPSLVTERSSGYTSPCVEGSVGNSRVTPDLLPLPVPEPLALRKDVDVTLFAKAPSTAAGVTLGTEAWLAVLVVEINAMGGHYFVGCTEWSSE